jgi:hypothetical protein
MERHLLNKRQFKKRNKGQNSKKMSLDFEEKDNNLEGFYNDNQQQKGN